MAKKLTPRSEDYSKWYNEIVVDADLAQHSDVKGCMVIKSVAWLSPPTPNSSFTQEKTQVVMPLTRSAGVLCDEFDESIYQW